MSFMFVCLSTLQRVKQFYQDANLGPTIVDVQSTAVFGEYAINPSLKTLPKGWDVQHNGLKKVLHSYTAIIIHVYI